VTAVTSGGRPARTRRAPITVAIALTAAAFVVATSILALAGADVDSMAPTVARVIRPLGSLPLLALGTVLLLRLPDNLYGAVWLAVGVSSTLLAFGQEYVAYSQHVATSPLPLLTLVAGLTGLCWATWIGSLALAMLLFPTGRPATRGWRVVALVTVGAIAVELVAGVFTPGEIGTVEMDNPYGVEGVAGDIATALLAVGGLVLSLSIVAGFVSLVVRYRHGTDVERHQVKWLASAAGLFAVALVLSFGWEPPPVFDAVVVAVQMTLLAGAVLIAVLRYRLYEIDRIVSRSVTYGLVTAVLVGLYLLLAVVPAILFDLDSDLLVATATLAAASAFVPLRRRVQAGVDRRFNRSRYDAARAAEGFAARVRDGVDLERLTDDLTGVVSTTLQPTTVSVWLVGDR